MVLPALLIVVAVASAALYGHLKRRRTRAGLWRAALTIGLLFGVVRAVLASAGWYVVEHTGGPMQIPAFALAMLAWPEGIVLGRHRGQATASFFVALGLVLVVGSLIWVSAVAVLVQLRRSDIRPSPPPA